jgi:8-oxo-dGTP pyrophosphatase MutT (NUDIX family)
LLSSLAHFIERHPLLHRTSLAVWKHFPPRLAGFLRTLLTTRWAVGAVAVIIDEEVNPAEVLLVQHSYRTKGAWGLPGGSLESGLRNPWEPSTEEPRDDIIESSLRREVFEELGIEIEIVRLTKIERFLTCRRSRGSIVSTSTTGAFPSRDSARCARGSAVGSSNRVRRK